MPNDSSTGGPLLPDLSGPAPLEGQALNQFLQNWLSAVIGFDPTLVRPRWQAEPANLPAAAVCWIAMGVTRRPAETYVMAQHDPAADNGDGASYYSRHERLELLVSFYDLGVNGQADYYCSLLVDGLAVAQNNEPLLLAGFVFVEADQPVVVPTLFKERWQYRVDLPVSLKRVTMRKYPIRNVLSLDAVIVAQGASGTPPLIIPASAPPH